MKLICSVLLLLSLFFAGSVRAEGNCPDGYYPIGGGGVEGCAPMPGGEEDAPPDPGPQWETRWGVVVFDASKDVFGMADGMRSKRKAQKAAAAQCKQRGGRACKIIGWAYNQCMALAIGDTWVHVSGGETPDVAQQRAISHCSAKSPNCGVEYSSCSYPERIR